MIKSQVANDPHSLLEYFEKNPTKLNVQENVFVWGKDSWINLNLKS